MNICAIIISLYLLVFTISQRCGGIVPQDQIQSGLIQVQNGNIQDRQHTYTFRTTNYELTSKAVEIALSLASIQNYRPSQGFDFSVTGGRKFVGKDLVIKLFINEDDSWSSLVISYFVSSNDFFITGFYGVNNFITSDAAENPTNYGIAELLFPSFRIKRQTQYDIKTFISGIRSHSDNFRVFIINSALDLLDSRILIQFETIAEPSIEFIQFSYIIYPRSLPNLIFNTLDSTYELTGLTKMRGSVVETSKFTVCQEQIGTRECSGRFQSFEAGRCVCDQNYFRNSLGECERVFRCGFNQIFDQALRTCICESGFVRTSNGNCASAVCSSRATLKNSRCVCNSGFYGDGRRCEQCHETCAQCSGPRSNQCIQCRDISFQLLNGVCSVNDCPIGSFKNDDDECNFCGTYCSECQNDLVCTTCALGFTLVQNQVFGLRVAVCESICGDGRRNTIEECDDNNTINGDGCSNSCKVQQGFFCQGSSSIQKSDCSRNIPNRTHIVLKGAVLGIAGEVIQSVRLSYLPDYFKDNNCTECSQILDIRVVSSTGIPFTIATFYQPNTQGRQYSVRFKAGKENELVTGAFIFTVRLNQKFSRYFKRADMDVVFEKQIDPSALLRPSQS